MTHGGAHASVFAVVAAGSPLVGHALAFRRDPLRLMTEAATLGPVVDLRLLLHRMWLVTTTELVDEILIARARQLQKSRLLRVLDRLALGDTLDSAAWAARIKQLAPAFRRQRLDALAPVIADVAAGFVAHGNIDDDALLALALRRILSVTLDDVTAACAHLRAALSGWSTRIKLGLPTPDWLPAPHNLAMRRAMRPLRRLVADAIAEQRARPCIDSRNLLPPHACCAARALVVVSLVAVPSSRLDAHRTI